MLIPKKPLKFVYQPQFFRYKLMEFSLDKMKISFEVKIEISCLKLKYN